MDFDYQAPVKDYKGQDEGIINLYITPCTAAGKDIQDLDLIASESPDPEEAVEELRGKPFNFKVNAYALFVLSLAVTWISRSIIFINIFLSVRK